MTDKVVLYCKHCENTWQSSLSELKKVIYRGEKKLHQKQASEYRAQCPKCGKFLVALIQDD